MLPADCQKGAGPGAPSDEKKAPARGSILDRHKPKIAALIANGSPPSAITIQPTAPPSRQPRIREAGEGDVITGRPSAVDLQDVPARTVEGIDDD